MNLKKYFKVWLRMTSAVFQADLFNRLSGSLYILGKAMRFLFFLGFLFLLLSHTKTLAGYNLNQVIFFFLTFNLIDIIVQLFLRGIYHFRPQVVSGNFDLMLVKPINPLFTALASHADVLDLITLFPLVGYMIYFLFSAQINFSILGLLLYIALITVSFLIALAIHIVVMGVGIMTTEVDNLVWIYRDLSGMGRIPVDLYREWVRNFLIFVVPIGVIMTFPAKALMGLLSWQMIIYSFIIAVIFLYLSLRFWKFALKRYSSASS
ncbi:MAG: ABC-2 family transporter protein [bacterium]|nr:ABC-2 family transporter protein [bacterium]